MKRLLMSILACAALALGCARAESSVEAYTLDKGYNGYYLCKDFTGGIPQETEMIFADLLLEGDEIVCGTSAQLRHRDKPDQAGDWGGAAMAVRRAGRMLLMGAKCRDGVWSAGVETDSFLPADTQIDMTFEDERFAQMTCGDMMIKLHFPAAGGLQMEGYQWTGADGADYRMDCYGGVFTLERMKGDDRETLMQDRRHGLPNRLCAWTLDTLPQSANDLIACYAAYSDLLGEDEAYISGVNVRERPTGGSRSYGIYAAKVEVIGQQPGLMDPWFHIRLGNLTGWVSGNYLHNAQHGDWQHICSVSSAVNPVARTTRETVLYSAPGRSAVKTLEPGTLLHVLQKPDGWLHVIAPREEISFQTDWDGTYGYIQADDAVMGVSIADVKWKQNKAELKK